MDHSATSTPKALEDQLRGMILGNVRVEDVQADQRPHQTQRGRGRGRGYYSRGNGRGHQTRAEQGQSYQDDTNSLPTVRGGRASSKDHQSYRQRQPRDSPHAQQGPGFPRHGAATGADGGHAVRGPSQPQQPRVQPRNGREVIPQSPAPRVFQSPQSSVHPRVQVQHSQVPVNHARVQAPHQKPYFTQPPENPLAEIDHFDLVAAQEIPKVEMSQAELEEKEAFRQQLESLMQQAFVDNRHGDIGSISLVGFGSLSSGFGMPGSDMDLAIVLKWSDPSRTDELVIHRDIPRLLERAVLDSKMGGRLLTRTRVPILKVCQYPTKALYIALSEERRKWDELSEKEKHPAAVPPKPSPLPMPLADVNEKKPAQLIQHADSPGFEEAFPMIGATPVEKPVLKETTAKAPVNDNNIPPISPSNAGIDSSNRNTTARKNHRPRAPKPWTRERDSGPLDFPKEGVGIHCDVNFGNPLGIHNTHMLRCYSLTDHRVRPLVLFVKAWAKRRQINSAYSGTLSSYGWVLMVLHFLVNIAKPPVCPNLQQEAIRRPKDLVEVENSYQDRPMVSGYMVSFWRNEQEITQAAEAGELSKNVESIPSLLRGFFKYYASVSSYGRYGPPTPQFHWTNEVLSLRTPGGLLSKQEKGWVSAKTTVTSEKKVTNRYLFAIEDPFEIDHNVARTVTHQGIVAIRDEFRRVWRIVSAKGRREQSLDGEIFDEPFHYIPPPVFEKVKKVGIEDLGNEEQSQNVERDQQAEVQSSGETISGLNFPEQRG
jgi:terminal uridylyltransferase